MKQYEAVIKVMEENGGYATLGFLYQEVLKISGVEWKTKTPFASIRRIVQDDRFFFKIKPGLWALKKFKNKLPSEILPQPGTRIAERVESDHTYYQGLLVEIGNLKGFQTSVPPQDKGRRYLEKNLGDLATVGTFYNFSYDSIVRRAQAVDVVWFNPRNMPDSFFEVEHTTDFNNALLKYVELQDFYSSFFIVSDKHRQREFEKKVVHSAFQPLSKRTRFLTYDYVSDWHTKTYELVALEKRL